MPCDDLLEFVQLDWDFEFDHGIRDRQIGAWHLNDGIRIIAGQSAVGLYGILVLDFGVDLGLDLKIRLENVFLVGRLTADLKPSNLTVKVEVGFLLQSISIIRRSAETYPTEGWPRKTGLFLLGS